MTDILLSAHDVTVQQGRRKLLDSVSFELMVGEIVTLIGPNGAGKTTLIKAMIGALPLSAGRIEKRIGLRLGYTPQKLQLEQMMPMPVSRFLALAGKVPQARRDAVLDQTHAATLVQSQLRYLSGG